MTEEHIEQLNLFNETKAPNISDSDTQATSDALQQASKQEIAQTEQSTQLALNKQLDTLPSTLRSAAETAMTLRNAQSNLINIATSEAYVASITAADPQALPNLITAVSNAVATSDNLLIQMGKIAEKNASMNRVFEIMTQQKQDKQLTQEQKKDEYYLDSIEKIKKSIYARLDSERNAEGAHTSDRYKNSTTEQDIIEAEYSHTEETEETEDA